MFQDSRASYFFAIWFFHVDQIGRPMLVVTVFGKCLTNETTIMGSNCCQVSFIYGAATNHQIPTTSTCPSHEDVVSNSYNINMF